MWQWDSVAGEAPRFRCYCGKAASVAATPDRGSRMHRNRVDNRLRVQTVATKLLLQAGLLCCLCGIEECPLMYPAPLWLAPEVNGHVVETWQAVCLWMLQVVLCRQWNEQNVTLPSTPPAQAQRPIRFFAAVMTRPELAAAVMQI